MTKSTGRAPTTYVPSLPHTSTKTKQKSSVATAYSVEHLNRQWEVLGDIEKQDLLPTALVSKSRVRAPS